jgi:NAD(P)-dependent dehydrogenase (short-subunit alcohol dehydrogenase family)
VDRWEDGMNLSGKTALVTGATDGVGRLVAHGLARGGARVLVHGRDADKGAAVMAEIRAATGSDKLVFVRADLAALIEVRALAGDVLEATDQLDILVNNAGVGSKSANGSGRETSRDGHELRFAVNHLAHFLLTLLLLPTLQRSAPARIVNVSSAGQQPIDFDDVMLTRGYDGQRAYRQSKLAQILFTVELAERLAGTDVTVTCLHPSTYMNTTMVRTSGQTPISKVEDGAEAVLRLATAPELAGVTGKYFNVAREARADAQAYDADARTALWELSQRLTGLA